MFEQEPRPGHAPIARDGDGVSGVKTPGSGAGFRRQILLWSLGLAAAAVAAGFAMGANPLGAEARRNEDPERSGESSGAPKSNFKFAVIINRPAGAPRVATGRTNYQGEAVFASCASCHATAAPNLETRRAEDLDQFHQGLKYQHGDLTCLSCHNSADYGALRLADTRSVEFSDVITVCSQCHGPQRRDYDRGLHGGMNGHWDLTRGGRARNTCVDCHDPHAPAFPMVLPVLPPLDRIAVPRKPSDEARGRLSH